MEDIISNIVKVLTHTILVHIYSYPHFSIEFFLACVICVVHFLLLFEVNKVYQRTNAKAAAKLRMRHAQLQGEFKTTTISYLSIWWNWVNKVMIYSWSCSSFFRHNKQLYYLDSTYNTSVPNLFYFPLEYHT